MAIMLLPIPSNTPAGKAWRKLFARSLQQKSSDKWDVNGCSAPLFATASTSYMYGQSVVLAANTSCTDGQTRGR